MSRPLVSIVINNHNYGRFLREAIDSALTQTYSPVEVVVADDGSTDDSRAIIRGYGESVTPVYQKRRGQTAAMNAGAAAARGEIICFLDADDLLLPDTVYQAVSLFDSSGTVNVHWPMRVIDADGRPTGVIVPIETLPRSRTNGSIDRQWVPSDVAPPNSGHAWRMTFLRQVLPLAELEQDVGCWTAAPDFVLFALAQLEGTMRSLDVPGGLYRVHGANSSTSPSVAALAERRLPVFEQHLETLARRCHELGLDVDPERWRAHSDVHRVHRATKAIKKLVRREEHFILLDDDQWNHCSGNHEIVDARFAVAFLERDGSYWEHPPDSDTAIRELERMREEGIRILAIAWSAFWWLDFYREFAEHVRSNYQCLLDADYILVYDLQRRRASAGVAP